MAKAEIQERRTFQYPPVIRLIRLVLRHRDPHKVRLGASALAGRLRSRFGGRVVGPEEPQIPRINDQYHRHILLKFEREASPVEGKALMKEDIEAFQLVEEYRSIRVIVDVDPY